MLDFADVVAVNKADKRGSDDAIRYVAKQVQRNREAFHAPIEDMPVFGCMASRYGDGGVDRLFQHLMAKLDEVSTADWSVTQLPQRAPITHNNRPTRTSSIPLGGGTCRS